MERVDLIRKMLENTPDDSFLQHALAMEYQALGRQREARQLLEELLRKDPSYVGSYYQLGGILQQMGERDLAIGWYRKGIEQARLQGERKAWQELQAALDDLEDL